jgi:hypothetical protein
MYPPGFRRFTPAIRRHTPSWVRPGTDMFKLHTSAGRTRERKKSQKVWKSKKSTKAKLIFDYKLREKN